MAEGERIRIDPKKIDTVCNECLMVLHGKYSLTCPYCHGQVAWVPKGSGDSYAKMLKDRGRRIT